MQEQNLSNHIRVAPKAYYLGVLLALAVFLIGIYLFIKNIITHTGVSTNGAVFMLFGLSLLLIGYYARMFALKAQDRAIRAEENLRCFALTGKLLHKELKMSQIIALRFAADEEFAALAEKAVKENLTNKQIKESVKSWRADHYRV